MYIELNDFELYKGKTLYQGHADVSVTIYDMKNNSKIVWDRHLGEMLYPINSGIPAQDKPVQQFEREFVGDRRHANRRELLQARLRTARSRWTRWRIGSHVPMIHTAIRLKRRRIAARFLRRAGWRRGERRLRPIVGHLAEPGPRGRPRP